MHIFKQITANNVLLEQYPFHRELSMEAYLIENESILRLDDDNFSDPNVLDVEIALREGRANSNGRIDILAQYTSAEAYAIIELKLGEINCHSLTQLEDYLKQRNQLYKTIGSLTNNETPYSKWIGILVGNVISKDLESKLNDGYEFEWEGHRTPIAAITLNRYRNKSNTEIYVTSDTYFKFNITNKDYSKYTFNGRQYGKGQLVNAVLKKFVEDHPATTYSDLEKVFPASIQGGTYGVFTTAENAVHKYEVTGYKRFKIAPDELISLQDSTIATCTQWSVANIATFMLSAKNAGYMIL